MKKLLTSLLILVSLSSLAQTYRYDTVVIYPNYRNPQSISSPLNGTLEFFYKNSSEYIKAYFESTGDTFIVKIDSFLSKRKLTDSKYIIGVTAIEQKEQVKYLITCVYIISDKTPGLEYTLDSVGFNDGVSLTIFVIKKPEKQTKTSLYEPDLPY